MKKLISAVIAAAMIASLGLTAFADNPITNESASKEAEIVVKTVIQDDDETYSVTIPADLEIEWSDTSVHDMNPKVTSQLKLGAKLTIEVTAEDGTKLNNAGYAPGLAYTATGLNTEYTFNEINNDAIPGSAENTVSAQVPDFTGVPVAVYQTTWTYTVTYAAS